MDFSKMSYPILLVCVLIIFSGNTTYAASINVTSHGSNGDVDNQINGNCSLQEAIAAASQNSPVDACVAGDADDLATDLIVLPEEVVFTVNFQLFLTSAITIQGNNSIVEAAASLDSVPLIVIAGNRETEVTLEDLTVRNANNTATDAIGEGGAVLLAGGNGILRRSTITNNKAKRGGGIAVTNTGKLVLEDTEVTHNEATEFNGGGVYIAVASGNDFLVHEITRSKINHNTTAKSGGGVSISLGDTDQVGARVDFYESEISHNSSATNAFGGGIMYIGSNRGWVTITRTKIHSNVAGIGGGAMEAAGTGYVRIFDSSVYNNSATNSAAGGLYASTFAFYELIRSTVSGNSGLQLWMVTYGPTLTESTIVGNPEPNAVAVVSEGAQISSTVISVGIDGEGQGGMACSLGSQTVFTRSSFFSDASCDGTASGNPKLEPLGFKGGPTPVHRPQIDSPLVNSATWLNNTAVDQRGYGRPPVAEQRDIGSVELTYSELGFTDFFYIPVKGGKGVIISL